VNLLTDDCSLRSSGSDLVGGVLGDWVGGGVVLALSSKHTLFDGGMAWVSGSRTRVRGVVVGLDLLSVRVVDGVRSVGVLAGLKLESRQIFLGEEV